TSVTIGAGVRNLSDSAFNDCENLGRVTIPNGVTNLGNSTFADCYALTNVAIGNGVRTIGDEAFNSCGSLTNLILPNSVTSIGSDAFINCYGLNTIAIPSKVASIADKAFRNCSGLKAINVNKTNSFYSSLDGVLFNKSQTKLICYPAGRTGPYTIPSTVGSIGNWAFAYCADLIGVTIPAGVTNIGSWAFAVADGGLTTITIPSSVKSIGDAAFFSFGLNQIYFTGDAPNTGPDVTLIAYDAHIYYLPWTTGWSTTFGGEPTVLWNPIALTGFGVRTNGFGFTLSTTNALAIVVEACTNLSDPHWQRLQTNTLTTGSAYFSDPQWTNYPGRFYRLRSP
ncbi:MAG TPA: leucine-rich repeat protein, partial [Sedimentisphaerales bacterium]